MKTPNLALIGFMASGKSTVGAGLAQRLDFPLIDLDQRIVEAAGCDIPAIFAAEGEQGFREREWRTAWAAAAEPRWIMACGGGIIHNDLALIRLRRRGRTVWLRLRAATLAARIVADGPGRPMIDDYVDELTEAAVLPRVRALLAQRQPLYEAAADIVVDLDGLTLGATVDLIVNLARATVA